MRWRLLQTQRQRQCLLLSLVFCLSSLCWLASRGAMSADAKKNMNMKVEVEVVTIFGFGSLMDVQSALQTMPSATNFRKGILQHHQRVYSLVSIGGLKSGKANLATKEVAALAARPSSPSSRQEECRGCSGSCIRGVLFDIPKDEFGPYVEREHRYLIEQREVQVVEWVGKGTDSDRESDNVSGGVVRAFTCLEQSDEQYLASLGGGADEWQERVGQYYPGGERLWGRPDILPMTRYMADVMAAASTLGGGLEDESEDVWLIDAVDNSFLVDGTTSLRSYVRSRVLSLRSIPTTTGQAQKVVSEFEQILAGKQLMLRRGSMTLLEYIMQESNE